MQTIIVGHHSRSEWIGEQQRAIRGAAAVIDYADEGALKGHTKALKIAQKIGERCVIMEDDAIPVVGFDESATDWCRRFPNSLISFYLGTGRPVCWQAFVDKELSSAGSDHIVLPRLIHGVCYSIPANDIARVISKLEFYGNCDEPADYLIGRAWGAGKQVIYPVESLVEHRDAGSVEVHPDGEPRTERRVARQLAGPLMY